MRALWNNADRVNRLTTWVMLLAIGINLTWGSVNVARGGWHYWLAALEWGAAVSLALFWRSSRRRIRYYRHATKLMLDSLDAPMPQGVRVVRADGTVQPCELVYRGCNEQGIHLWEVAGMRLGPGDHLFADVMPGMTGIEFEQR